MRYIPHTEQDVKQMLAEIGVKNIDELFDSIPESLRLNNELLALPPSLPESELTEYLKRLQKKILPLKTNPFFWVRELIAIFPRY